MRTNEIFVTIEKLKDHYSAFATNVEGIYGAGDTAMEAKQSILDAIELFKEHNGAKNISEILRGEFKVVYRFDTESLLNYFRGIFTNSALEKITGINQRQLQHYASGLKKPREPQKKKIEEGLHKLGNELLELEL